MAVNTKSGNDTTKQTPVQILNQSFDQTSQTLVSQVLGYDPDTQTVNRVKVTPDGKMEVNASVTATGSDGAIVDGVSSTIKATVKDLTNSNPLTVAITDGNGDQITSFGGGTQYTEGDVDASITGTAVMWENGGNTIRVASHQHPLPVDTHFEAGTLNEFGHLITGSVNNQVDIQYYRSDGSVGDLVTETNANGGTATASNGMATFSATTTTNSQAKGVSTTNTTYTAGAEIYCIFTAGWTGNGSGTSYQRLGLYDDNNGFFVGFEGNTFKATVRKGGVDTGAAKASFSVDPLIGGTESKFTRNGVPEAVDLTKLNVWRIRFGWVGSAPINFEILSPDGNWVTFHEILQPNLSNLPHINNADLPITCDVNSGNSGSALTLITNCWAAGTTQSLSKINSTITTSTLAGLTRSVITGETTAGGGGFVNVKVNPSGTLETNATISSLPNEGQQTMANSISVAVASNQSAIPVSQSGTWDEVGINDSGNSITVDYNGSAISTSNPLPIQPPLSGYLNVAIDQTGNNNAVDVLTMPTTTVQATDLDIRNLSSAQDSVTVTGTVSTGLTQPLTDTELRATPVPVSGTFYQATQPVSLASLPSLATGSNLVGKVSIDQVTANANEVVTKTGSVTTATLSAETTKVIGTVNISSGQSVTAIDNVASTTTITQVSSSATNVTLKASNSSRKMLIIVNDSTAVLYVKFGSTASSTSYTYKLSGGDTLEIPHPVYTGAVDGIWASANGNAYVTEY